MERSSRFGKRQGKGADAASPSHIARVAILKFLAKLLRLHS
jgi:hypothetical protein